MALVLDSCSLWVYVCVWEQGKYQPVPLLVSDKPNSSPWRTFEPLVGSDLTAAVPACCPESRRARAEVGQPPAAVVLPRLEWQGQQAVETRKMVRIFLIDMNNGFKLWAGQRCVQTIRALLCSGLWSQIEMPWVCLTPAWPMSLMVLLLSYKTKDHWKNTCLFEFQIRENKSKIHLEGKTCYLNIYIYCKCICFSLCNLHKSIDRIFRLKDEFSTINHRGWLLVWADMA